MKGKIFKKLIFDTFFDNSALHLEGTGSSPVEFNWRGSLSLISGFVYIFSTYDS
jgi:hypothetical protein